MFFLASVSREVADAQMITGEISGMLLDESDAVVPGTTVTVVKESISTRSFVGAFGSASLCTPCSLDLSYAIINTD